MPFGPMDGAGRLAYTLRKQTELAVEVAREELEAAREAERQRIKRILYGMQRKLWNERKSLQAELLANVVSEIDKPDSTESSSQQA